MKSSTAFVALRVGLLGVAAWAVSVAAAAQQAAPSAKAVMTAQQMTLPPGTTTFPAGPGSDLANQHCVICHSTGMVLRQPPLSFDEWKAEVAKMRAVYGAPLPQENIEAIARYLTAINGRP